MKHQELIDRAASHAKSLLALDRSGHDYWHVERVWRLARHIGRAEGADLGVVELAAWLHDIADWKFHNGDAEAGPQAARAWLVEQGADENLTDHVCRIIAQLSFKGAGVASHMDSLEGQVVQDADRLDAIGAIGVARAFAYGGYARRPLYDPTVPPQHHQSFEAYKSSTGHTINHFYEKLLLLKDRMNTPTARSMATRRHEFLKQFLDEFFAEWNNPEQTHESQSLEDLYENR